MGFQKKKINYFKHCMLKASFIELSGTIVEEFAGWQIPFFIELTGRIIELLVEYFNMNKSFFRGEEAACSHF
jgi:hypothetical protein